MLRLVRSLVVGLENATGLEESQVQVLLCTLLSFPFGIVFKRLPDKNYTLKNVYIISVSAFYIYGVLNLYDGVIKLFVASLGSYFITRYVRTNFMPWINFTFLMLYLAYQHILVQFVADDKAGKIDITGALMVLVMKLSAFGWSIHDAKQPKDTLSEYAKSRAIRRHPNLLFYLGYVFFYASLLTGPAFDYVDYERFIYSTLFDDVPDSKRPGSKRKRRIPRSGFPSFMKLVQGLFWAMLLFILGNYVSVDYVLSGFLERNGFIYRIFYLWILGFFYRLKYYAIWMMAEGACIQCGIGYNGYDENIGQFKWNRVQNVDPVKFETGQNVHVCLESWNMNTNKWLKNYVYVRLARKGKKPGFKSTLVTFATSAFWHGTNPGYFLTFIMGAFLQTVGKIFRKNLRPMFLENDGVTPKASKKFYDIACYFVTQLSFGFIVQPFILLDFWKSIYVWRITYFYVQIGVLLTMFLFQGPLKNKVKSFCVSHSPSLNNKEKSERTKLNDEESTKVRKAVASLHKKEDAYPDAPSLGLPPIDVLEDMDEEDMDDLKELKNAWYSFKSRGGLRHDDVEAVRAVYKNFTDEINDIYQTARQEWQNKAKQT
ncbi:Piso0_003580 [Millerozyma farinosa CBS 7064]|uniref:Piso0_003580 protein n=1 Tax=Pichia sorbitophila (strain ATCC MYA-4447 / BCRC 22081 / CBS 7064 / NBRC 10061 / NRRL Y-12695) TaxID=559304 RepID=G8YGB1_PICSO|nr:Piso0_003580 [Millerozyma farinosa CBS 7064]CCE81228.1 Piso0_003580 [Millerozyma farinosa CBS 7064]